METVMQGSDTLVMEIDIAASPARVFEAWVDPRQRLEWWGDDATYRCTTFDSDLRVGGAWRVDGKGTQGRPFTVHGVYTRVDRPHALGFTWNHEWGGAGQPETHVLIELVPTSSGTHLTVTHSGFADESVRNDHDKGWLRVLTWLQGYLRA